MDLEENIRIAAEQFIKDCHVFGLVNALEGGVIDLDKLLIDFSKSQAAKDYWYNEFKRQKIQSDSGQDQSLTNQPMKRNEYFNGKSTLEANYTTVQKDNDRRVQIVIPDLSKLDGVSEEYERAKQYQEYIDEHPDRPISFDNWKYMVEHYKKPELLSKQDIDDVVLKRIGIIGHVNHCKPMVIVLNDSWDAARQALNNIQSIVPISDVIPEPIISKQELLLMNDEDMKRSIAEETYKESRAWDIKKEKKVSHKRTNKRK